MGSVFSGSGHRDMARCRLRDFVPAFFLAATTFAGVAVFTLMPAARVSYADTGQVAVIFAPWVDLTDGIGRIARADGRPVRMGRFQNVIVVQPDHERFFEDVKDQGAWFVIDPAFAGGCFVSDTRGSAGD